MLSGFSLIKKSHWQYCLCVYLLYTCATANNANDAHPFCFTELQTEHCNLTVTSLLAPNSSFRGKLNAPLSQRVTVLHPSLCFFFFPLQFWMITLTPLYTAPTEERATHLHSCAWADSRMFGSFFYWKKIASYAMRIKSSVYKKEQPRSTKAAESTQN